jgi:hypothetical protein
MAIHARNANEPSIFVAKRPCRVPGSNGLRNKLAAFRISNGNSATDCDKLCKLGDLPE